MCVCVSFSVDFVPIGTSKCWPSMLFMHKLPPSTKAQYTIAGSQCGYDKIIEIQKLEKYDGTVEDETRQNQLQKYNSPRLTFNMHWLVMFFISKFGTALHVIFLFSSFQNSITQAITFFSYNFTWFVCLSWSEIATHITKNGSIIAPPFCYPVNKVSCIFPMWPFDDHLSTNFLL